MSYQGGAAAPPVEHCSFAGRGCEATFRDSGKWARIRAADDGWFFSRQEDAIYCPAHVPDWVPAWRSRQARRVDVTSVKVAARARCQSCSFDEQADEGAEDAIGDLRLAAREHAASSGHVVTMTTGRRYTYTPARANS